MSQVVLCAGTAWGGHMGVGRRANNAVCVLLGGEPVTSYQNRTTNGRSHVWLCGYTTINFMHALPCF